MPYDYAVPHYYVVPYEYEVPYEGQVPYEYVVSYKCKQTFSISDEDNISYECYNVTYCSCCKCCIPLSWPSGRQCRC